MSKTFLIRPWKGDYEEVTAERVNEEYKTLCPFHDDHTPSLSINSEKSLFKCFGCDAKGSAQEILGIYDYREEDGQMVYQEIKIRDRKDPSKKYALVRQPTESDEWQWDIRDVRRVIYNLSEVIKSDVVFVVEGPKDAETLRGLGLVGTTAPFGASAKWKPEFNQWFKSKDVIVIPDNDKPGKRHALDVCRNLKLVANKVRVLDLPDVKEKEDVTDWLEKGHTKEELLKLVESTPEWMPVEEKDENQEPEEPEEPIIFRIGSRASSRGWIG